MSKQRYYLSSFFWSTATKILNAFLGFVSVPLLIGLYGRAEYGILALATSCNSYMHLLDLGMNTGAVRHFSSWRSRGELGMIERVARTNISFYCIIALINALIMTALALFGEGLFSISHEQFITLRYCLLGIAALSLFSWTGAAFNQLLVSDMQISWTLKVQFIQVIAKAALIVFTLKAGLAMPLYFFLLNLTVALLVVPYAWKCRRDGLISSLAPGFWWKDFRIVLLFSLSVFALSFFQITATESRLLVLSIFRPDSAQTLTDFKIISVVPSLVIAIGGSLTSIFLPRCSAMIARGEEEAIQDFALLWTRRTSIIASLLCFPFILGAPELISAYVGPSNAHLAPWMALWCAVTLVQIHTAPEAGLILAKGKMKPLVLLTAAACLVSIILNALLCRQIGSGSAVIGYCVYVLLIVLGYYVLYYRRILGLNPWKILRSFLLPSLAGAACALVCAFALPLHEGDFSSLGARLGPLAVFCLRSLAWLLLYCLTLLLTRLVGKEDLELRGK